MTLKEQIEQADDEYRTAIREQIPLVEAGQVKELLDKLTAEYRRKQVDIWLAYRSLPTL